MLKVLDTKKKEKRVKPGRFPSTQAPCIYPQIEVIDAEPVALDNQSRTHKWSNPPTAARKSSDKSGATGVDEYESRNNVPKIYSRVITNAKPGSVAQKSVAPSSAMPGILKPKTHSLD